MALLKQHGESRLATELNRFEPIWEAIKCLPSAQACSISLPPRRTTSRRLAKSSRARRGTDRWRSGRSRTLGKRVYVKAYRGFESLSVRHRPRLVCLYRAALTVTLDHPASNPEQIAVAAPHFTPSPHAFRCISAPSLRAVWSSWSLPVSLLSRVGAGSKLASGLPYHPKKPGDFGKVWAPRPKSKQGN